MMTGFICWVNVDIKWKCFVFWRQLKYTFSNLENGLSRCSESLPVSSLVPSYVRTIGDVGRRLIDLQCCFMQDWDFGPNRVVASICWLVGALTGPGFPIMTQTWFQFIILPSCPLSLRNGMLLKYIKPWKQASIYNALSDISVTVRYPVDLEFAQIVHWIKLYYTFRSQMPNESSKALKMSPSSELWVWVLSPTWQWEESGEVESGERGLADNTLTTPRCVSWLSTQITQNSCHMRWSSGPLTVSFYSIWINGSELQPDLGPCVQSASSSHLL